MGLLLPHKSCLCDIFEKALPCILPPVAFTPVSVCPWNPKWFSVLLWGIISCAHVAGRFCHFQPLVSIHLRCPKSSLTKLGALTIPQKDHLLIILNYRWGVWLSTAAVFHLRRTSYLAHTNNKRKTHKAGTRLQRVGTPTTMQKEMTHTYRRFWNSKQSWEVKKLKRRLFPPPLPIILELLNSHFFLKSFTQFCPVV